MATYLQELERLPEILEQIEDLKAAHLPQATPHRANDRAGIRTYYGFGLRHYLGGTPSNYSGINTPSTPSFRVSVLETSSSTLTSEYHTAPMSQISNGECCQPSRKCTQILVRNVGVHPTMLFQVDPEDTIGTIKSLVRERIGLEHASFELLYSSRVLKSSDQTIDEYGIPHDATLTCLSFRLNILSCVIIKTLTGITFSPSVKADTLVYEVKEMCAGWLSPVWPRTLRPTDIRLIHAGKELDDHHRLSDYGTDNKDTLYLVSRLGGPPAAPDDKSLKSQEDEARPPDPEPENIGNQALSFWKAPFGTPWLPRRRVYGHIKT